MRNQAECLALLEALTTDYGNFLVAAAIPPGSPLHLAYVLMGIGSSSAEDIGDAVNRPKNTFTGTMQTSSTGSQAVRLPSNLASEVTVHNRTGVQLAWQYVVDNVPVGQLIRIDPGMAATIPVMGNSDLVALRRFDQSNSQVTVNFEGVLM
jgi:hypothetical protein